MEKGTTVSKIRKNTTFFPQKAPLCERNKASNWKSGGV